VTGKPDNLSNGGFLRFLGALTGFLAGKIGEICPILGANWGFVGGF
jgi:hypothetical protein